MALLRRFRPLKEVWLAVGGVAVLLLALFALIPLSEADAQSAPTVEISGAGWGHGRGMGQYGAYGYASDYQWSSRQILDHYYGGTTQGSAPSTESLDPSRLKVELSTMSGRPTTVALLEGTIDLLTADGSRLSSTTAGAVRLSMSGGGFSVQTGAGCLGPWSDAGFFDGATVRIVAKADTSDQSSASLLQVCGPYHRTWYEGEIRAVAGDTQHTTNIVTVDQYLRGVVPNEIPASWPEAALEAQAVAARSYVLAGDERWGSHANTCDSTLCQVYDGRYTTRGSWREATHERTDAAISATKRQVRITSSGEVARTEFSSSTGGYTAGGDFPAVDDAGDSIAANPNHRWKTTIDLSSVEAKYGKGPIADLVVTKRNGFGPFDGRVEQIELRFRDGTVTLSGWEARTLLDLKSDLFSVGPVSRGGVPTPTTESTPEPDSQVTAVTGLFTRLAGRAPNADELQTWTDAYEDTDMRQRRLLVKELVYDEHFAGVLVDDLYRSALNRRPDDSGRSYWVTQLDGKVSFAEIGTNFFGSPEYFRRSGNTNKAFVEALYLGILERPADGDGLRYWTSSLGSEAKTPADVAASFYASVESRRSRAKLLHVRVTGRGLGGKALDRAAERLVEESDLNLAVSFGLRLRGQS